jgi:hypothetical protein
MGKKTMKAAAVVALLGTVLQFGGCINSIVGKIFGQALGYVGLEFLTDNNGVFDLFTDN